MTRNPIYQALCRTRLMPAILRDYRKDQRIAAATAAHEHRHEAIRDLIEIGAMTRDEAAAVRIRIDRRYHAAVLKLHRADTKFVARRRFNRETRKFHEEGLRL